MRYFRDDLSRPFKLDISACGVIEIREPGAAITPGFLPFFSVNTREDAEVMRGRLCRVDGDVYRVDEPPTDPDDIGRAEKELDDLRARWRVAYADWQARRACNGTALVEEIARLEDPLPRTGREHAASREKVRAAVSLRVVSAHLDLLRALLENNRATPGNRTAFITAASAVVEAFARFDAVRDVPADPDFVDDSDLIGDIDVAAQNAEKRHRAMALRVPIDDVDIEPLQALEFAARGDYDITWHQAAGALGIIERYRVALTKIANANHESASIAKIALSET